MKTCLSDHTESFIMAVTQTSALLATQYFLLLALDWRCAHTLDTHLDILEKDAATTHVLVFHQLLGVLSFVFRLLLEKVVESFQRNVISVKVECLSTKLVDPQ
jgi:hypothetical protein